MIYLDKYFFFEIAPKYSGSRGKRQLEIIETIAPLFIPTLGFYDINTKLRIAHFIGQIAHECAGFCTTEEFASGAAYEGRQDLGNTKRGDGIKYKGRGLIQLTGRANYKRIGDILNIPLEDYPELASDPINALKIACEYWKSRNINKYCDTDDLTKITKLVNGGLNGLEDRKKYYLQSKELLDFLDGTVVIKLQLNDKGFFVRELQRLLNTKNVPCYVDGDFGSKTFRTVIQFQKNMKLVADGIVGKSTWKALRS